MGISENYRGGNFLFDSVCLQTKNNGAAALAFFEYIKQEQLNELKDYILKALHDLTKNNRTSELSKLEQLIIKLKLTKIDYLIHLNKHFFKKIVLQPK